MSDSVDEFRPPAVLKKVKAILRSKDILSGRKHLPFVRAIAIVSGLFLSGQIAPALEGPAFVKIFVIVCAGCFPVLLLEHWSMNRRLEAAITLLLSHDEDLHRSA